MFDEQDRKYFYDEFKKNGYDVGSYDDFKKDLGNKEDRDWYYNEAKGMGYDVGSQQDFDKMVLEPTTSSPSSKQDAEVKATGGKVAENVTDAAASTTLANSKPSTPASTAKPLATQPSTPSSKETEAQLTGIVAGVSGFMPTQVSTSNGTYQPSPSIPQPNVVEAKQQEMPQEPDATTGATPQSAASIYSTHFGKDGAISETVADLLQRGLANTPDEALEMARNAAYDNATRIALAQTNDITKRLGDSTEDEERSLHDIYYTHPIQDKIKDDARRNGLSYDDYVKNHLKPAMVESLVSRYGENHRKMAEGVATRLFAHEGDVDNMLEKNDNINDAAALVAKYAAAPVSDAIKKAEAASNAVMGKYNEQSKYVDSASPFSIGALSDANKERDPRKILNSLQGTIRSIVKNPHFIGELANLMRSKGYDTKQMDKYVKAYVLPQLQGVFENELNKQEISKIMPRGSFEYILKSGLGNTIVGQVSRKITQTDYQNWLEDMASQQYQPGFWERVASGALTFAGDAWSYWLPGAAGGKVTRSMMAKAEGKLASDLIANGMEKGMAGRAAKVLIGRSKGMALKTGAVHGATTFGGQAVVSTPINEIYKDGQLDENGKVYHTSVGKTLAHTLEEVTKGAVLGSVIQGGTLANLMSKGKGLAANILADVGGKMVDSGIMTGQALLERMAKDPSFKPTGKDASESFLESMANLTAIGLPGMVGKYARFKDANEFNRKYDFTEDDIAELRKRGYDDLRTAFEQMGIKGDSEVQLSPERNDQYTTQYLGLLRDGSVPETTKAKVMSVIEGKRPDSFSPVMDSNVVKGDDGKFYLETYNKDGGVIERVGYGSEEKAREAERELDYEKSLNLASAYEKAYQMYNFQEQVDDTYNNAADKYANGGTLSETDKAAIFLHQKQGDFAKVTQKVANHEQLTPGEQKLYEVYSTVYGNLYQGDTSMREYLATFEDSRGLVRGSLRKALEGHSQAEASKMSDDVVYVGNGKYRTKDEAELVDDYMGQLFNDISYKRELRQTKESMAGRKLEDQEHPQETEQTQTAELHEQEKQEIEPPTKEEQNPPTDSPSSSDVSDAYQMGLNAYASNDMEALRSIDYNDDLAEARLRRFLKDDEPLLNMVLAAVDEGKDMEQLIAQYANKLNDVQQDAIRKYAEASNAARGVMDAVSHADDGYKDALEKLLWPYATEDGNIVPATLTNGSQVFLKKANEYGGAFVVVPDEQGNPTVKQVSSAEIAEVSNPVAFDDFVSQKTDERKNARMDAFAALFDGSGVKPNEQVQVAMEPGDDPVTMVFAGYDGKGNIVLSDGKDNISIAKEEFAAWRNNANESIINAELDAEDAQRENDAAAKAEVERKQRYANGIVGYGDGKMDYSSKDSDPSVVAEYLNEEYGEDHDKLLKLVNGSREDIKEQLDNKRKVAARYKDWLDTNADLDPKKARKIEDELKFVTEQMEDLDARLGNWNTIRNSVMTPDEAKAMHEERKQEIYKAGVDKESIVLPENREIPVLSNEELRKQYPTMAEASAYISSQRRTIYKMQSNEVQGQLDDVNDMLEQYVNGDIDLEPEQLKEINTAKALLEARMDNLSLSAKDLRAQENKLSRIYKRELSQQEMESPGMSPSEQRRFLVADALKKNDMKAIKEIYKDSSVDVMDLEPLSLEEEISMYLSPRSLNAESFSKEIGISKYRGIGRNYDSNKLNVLFAKKGEGMTVAQFSHKVYQNLPANLEAMGYTDQDVRNTVLDMFLTYDSVREIRNVALMNRIAAAESELSAEEEYIEEQKEREIIERQKEIEDFNAYIHDKELSLPTESELNHIYGMEYDRMMDIEDREKEYKEYIKQILPELSDYDDRRTEAENAGSGGLDQDTSRRGVVEGSGKGQETLRGEALAESKTGESVDSGRTGRQANSGLERGEGSASGASHLSPEASFGERLSGLVDKQGNPINEDGSLMLEKVKSVDELTDDDFLRPSRNVQLPVIPSNVDAAIGANGKPVVIKKNIFERNKGRHGDVSPKQSRQIFKSALYNADLYGQNQKKTRPYNWVLINTKDEKGKNRTLLLEVNPNKDNVEVVHWYYVNDKNLELIKKQAIREGDQVLILPSDNSEEVGGLSNLTDGLSAAKINISLENSKEKDNNFSERLKNAIAETETSPSDAQKKAGNYKKGHLSFGGYDFTVETPKGVTRSGKDENGKPWSVTMHDTYGYVLGKIGVDGDHIDMFINDSADLDDFDGNVVVIDQVNPETGEFDEHKVMYGYPDEVTAVNAYMKNYSKDWKGLGKATSVPKVTFDKWLQSSDRKTKPFHDYAMIQKEEAKKYLQKLPLLDEPTDIVTWMQQHPGQFPDSSDLFGEGQSKKQLGKEVGRQSNTTDKGVVLSKIDYEGGYVLEARHGGDFVKQLYYPDGQLMTRPKFAISGDADSFKKYVHFDEKGVPHVKTSEILDSFMDSLEKRNADGMVRYQNVDLEDIPNEYRDFSDEYGVNPENLFMYGESMKYNDSALASRNFRDLKSQYLREHIEDRKAIMDRDGVSGLIANRRLFAPIEKAIKKKYGDVDVLIEVRKKRVEEERNVMETARKRAEEEERKRQQHLEELSLISDNELDKRYLDAIGKGNEQTAREMLDEAARRKGFSDAESDYQGVGAWAAPSNPGFATAEERRTYVEENGGDVNVEDIAAGYSPVDEEMYSHPERTGFGDESGLEAGHSINDALNSLKAGKTDVRIKVYRAVPISVKEGKLRNGDWVTPSRKYAEMHGNSRLEGKYRIIEDEVPAKELWFDGNDIREWGYDNGKNYRYKNVKNNRKLNDLVTRDDKGNIIPPSMRFNSRKADERYQKADSITSPTHREVILRDTIINKLRENGIDVIDDVNEGQYVLDHVKGKAKLQAMISNLAKAAKTVKGWLSNNTRNKSFSVELPESTMRLVHNALGRDFNQHLITANNVAHAKANHGVQGKKLSEKSIPLRDEDFELIPYILTAPTRVQRGSIDAIGRESVRFVKEISNGTILVVEKEQKNSPDGMETITMWAEKSSSNGADALSNKGKSPTIDARNVIISTEDAAKIRKDAETAIKNDEKLREQRVFPHSDADFKFFRTPNGEAYGYTVGGKIYIDPRIANAETPIHEYAHLWSAALRSGNPREWENIVSLMKGLNSVWEKVKREYPDLETDGDIADEVLSQYSGKRGAERLRKEMDDIANGDILEKAQAMDALHRLKKVLAKFWKDVCDFLHIHFTSAEEVADRVMKDLLDGIDPRNFLGKNNSARTLVGVHNISEEKLEKAIKQGGLANPSIAVIDSAKQTHDGYGDISLILPSDKVAKRTGRNAGTWQGDAWTPTYPQVERLMDSKGSVKASKDISSVPTEMQPAVRRDIDRWLDGNNTNSGMSYLFLHERGEEPQLKKTESKYDEKVYNALRFITAGDFNIFGIGETDTKKVLDMYIDARYGGDRGAYEQKTKEWLDKNKALLEGGKEKGLRYAFAKQDMEMYDEYGFNFKSVQRFVNDVQRDGRNGGKADVEGTLKSAEDYIKEHNLTDDFSKWIDEKEKQYGVKEVIFDGFTPSGKRKYIANTLENVSKIMKKQGRNGSSGLGFSFNNFAARLMPSYGKLSEIRSQKGLLTSNHEDLDSFREKWGDVFFELGKKCQPDAENPFDDYGMERLSEAALQKDPQAYLKKEYNVDFSDKDLKRLNEMIKAIKEEYPAMYFETKFERPVGFGEFSAAVVPVSTKDEVKKALLDSGVQIFEYDKKIDGDRKRAFDAAINSDSAIRFMFAGVNGAATADMADEKMERMANWNMARQMEKEKLGALPIKMATGWERGIDGKWRYEIPDFCFSNADWEGKNVRVRDKMSKNDYRNLMRYTNEPYALLSPIKKRNFDELRKRTGYKIKEDLTLGDVIFGQGAENLFKFYPKLRDIKFEYDDLPYGTLGFYDDGANKIVVTSAYQFMPDSTMRVLHHEVQHAIQQLEGFSKGGNPSQFSNSLENAMNDLNEAVGGKLYDGGAIENNSASIFKALNQKTTYGTLLRDNDSNLQHVAEKYGYENIFDFVEDIPNFKGAHQMYRSLAGEVEARNVVNRMGLSDEERRKYLAKQTEDVDRAEQIMDGDGVSYSLVENPDTIKKLDKEDTITVYRAMQLGDDGNLYPPMAAKVKGKFVQPIELGKWEQADERPELADGKGLFTLNKGNGKTLKVAYNPYLHTSYTPLNDQFSEAQDRPNIVTVEVQVPKSELTSGYKAEKAKDAVGELEWNAGVVQGQLTGKRKVVLSRWDKPVRIVPDSEVADVIVNDMFKGKNITMPSNVVTPSLRKELEKRGVPFVETDNKGKIIGGENDGVHYSKVYNIRKPSKVKKAFGVPYDYVKYPLGKVEPDLANKEVEIVPADANHGFKNYKEAKTWAKENISKVYDNDESGEKGIVRISNGAIDKFLSQSAVDKSDTKDVHLSVLKVLPEVLKNSIEAEVHPDFFKGKDGKRVSANGFNKDVLVHRCYGAADIDGKLYRVKITLKEDLRDSEFPHVTHSYEATKIELLAGTWENPITSPSPNTNNSIVGANLLKNVEMSYAKGKKLLDESEKNDFSSNNLPDTIDKVQNTANQMGGAGASVYTSLDEVPEEYREQVLQGARGWYDPSTHTVHVYLPNCSDGNEAQRTVFHEKVGHEGLEVLLGGENGVRKFADFVYKSVGKETRGKILGFANKYDPQWQNSDRLNVGTQEYIAHLAEDGPATAEEFSLWTKMKHYLIRLLKKLGIRVPGLLNDKDLRYYLMKAGKALHVWDEMPKEKQEAMMSQASNAEVKDALGEGDMKGKPRQKKGESTIQYMKRVREWRKWKEAREDMEDPEPPQFYDLEKDMEGKKEWDRLNKEWRDRHSLVGDDMPIMPKREDGEGDESFFPRYKEYEKWQNALKDANDPMPDMFAWEKQKQAEATKKYEDWLVRHDLAEQEQADLDLYEGKIYPAEVSPEAADLDRKVMQDLAEVTSTDVSKEGASLKVKHAVIHRRKNMEEASADDAIYIGDIKRSIEKIADGGLYDKLLSSYSGKKTKAERLAEAIPYIIEAPRRLRDITHAMNATGAFEKNHLHIQPGDVEAVQPYLGDLRHLTAKVHYELKDGKEVMVYDEPKAVTEIASKIAQAINANHSLEEGFVPVDSTDILNKNVLPVIGKKIVPSGIDYHDLSVEMMSTLDAVRDWYNYTYDWLKDNHTLKDDTGFNRDYVNHLWDKENSDPAAYAMYVENRQRTKSPNEKPRTISTLMEGLDVGLAPKTTDITKMMAYYSRSNIEAWANKTMLQEVSGINVVERNEEGEIISCDPLLSSTPPFNLEQYKYFEIPGVGPVWVYNVSPKYHAVKNPLTGKDKVLYSEASAGERFGVVFDTYQSNKFWKAMDTIASTMKKLELGFSGFHAGALTEVYMVQNMIEFGPKKAFANFMKYIFIDTAKNHSLPCFANPEDFQEAATHLVKFGATNDYAAADVQNMYDNLHDGIRKIHQRLSEASVVGKTVGVAVTPLEIATQMVSFINKGMDVALWDFLHDGLKLATYKMRSDRTKERAKKLGWTAEQLSKQLDEDGQFVNDMFGGQHWDVLGTSHRKIKYAGRILLSPDWNVSTTRHFLAMTGYGSLWNEASFDSFGQYYKRTWSAAKGKENMSSEDWGRFSRSKSALLCYGIGVMVAYECLANALNAAFRALDEEKEQEKADEIRKTNPSYKSSYELAYPDGMKWYDYLMRGNSLGQQSKIFLGRYQDGSEMYIRHGKQFREVPEYFFNHKGEFEFPGPMMQRMLGKANPLARMLLDNFNYVSDFQSSHADQELQRKYGKTIGLLYKDALYFAPFLIPSQENKEFKFVDFFFPSAKGFSKWKAQDYFKTFILCGDMRGVALTYQSCQRNGIDPEEQIKAAIGSVKALESAEMQDGVTSLQIASQRFDEAKSITEKKKMRQKMKKFLSQGEYKVFTQKEALDMVQDYLNGDEDIKEMEKNDSKYLMHADSKDITEDWRIQVVMNGTKDAYDEYKHLRETDKGKARAFADSWKNKRLFDARKSISKARKKMNKSKKEMDGSNYRQKMVEIRKVRKELLKSLATME